MQERAAYVERLGSTSLQCQFLSRLTTLKAQIHD
jgi:hypothetical protein